MDDIQQDENQLPAALSEACQLFGVERSYWDIFGKQHHATEEVLKAILGSLGVDASSDEALAASLSKRHQPEGQSLVPSTLVLSAESPELKLAANSGIAHFTIEFEDGTRREFNADLTQRVHPGKDLPLGYHRLRISLEGHPDTEARLILCPDRAYQPEWLVDGKSAGVAVSLYGTRSHRNWGSGDCTDLRVLIDWAAELGCSFVALNPLHAIPNRQPYNTSPYLPNSSFYRNHIYLDIEEIEEFQDAGCGAKLMKNPAVQAELKDLREARYVEYERVSKLKLRFLKVLFRRFLTSHYRPQTERGKAFAAYVEQEGHLLHLYAVHSALDEAIHREKPEVWNWHSWPEGYRDPESAETQEFARKHWRSVLLHKYIQWELLQQFAKAQQYALDKGLKIGLYHDLALATDSFGSDLWAHGPFYAKGCRVGSPPDDFSPKGQDWAFPPPNSDRHFHDGYRLFAESIRKASANGGALRIDHVMRFFRLYWIPDGKDATEGTYVQDRYQDLIRILALESVRGKFIVIGEDLGTVPDLTRQTLESFGVLSYRLFFFERDREGRFKRPDEYPRQALVSASTHDLPTLAGFWQNADIDARKAAGVITDDKSYERAVAERSAEKQKMLTLLQELNLLPDWFPHEADQVPQLTGELHNAIIGFLASTPSQLLVVNQEDLFKDTDQQNLPGTTAEHPNWRHKMRFTVEELTQDEALGYSSMLRGWLQRTGRA